MSSEQPSKRASGATSKRLSPAGDSRTAELRDQLEQAKRAILQEIRNYPRPIAGCDQQFNYLLEERDRIADELSRLASVEGGSGAK